MAETNKTVIVWAGLRVKDGFVETFKQAAASVIASTRKEPKCIRYDLLQDTEDANSFFFFEEYSDEDGYAAHRATPYLAEFRKRREQMLDKYLGLRVLKENA